ncbi:hypothetical protein CL616_04105 [archaeon]|nr:hypothetical protein [archaeon]
MNEDKDTDGQSYPGIEETDRLAGSLDSVADESQYELVEERCRDYEFNGDVVAHLVVSKNPKGSYRSAFSTLRSLDTLLRMAHSLTIEQRLAMQKEEPGLYRALSFYHLEPTSQDVIPDETLFSWYFENVDNGSGPRGLLEINPDIYHLISERKIWKEILK